MRMRYIRVNALILRKARRRTEVVSTSVLNFASGLSPVLSALRHASNARIFGDEQFQDRDRQNLPRLSGLNCAIVQRLQPFLQQILTTNLGSTRSL